MSTPLIERISLRWVLAYIGAAALWIALMQWLLGSLGGERWTISAAGLVVGGIFVLITAWLLFLLLERLQGSSAVAWHKPLGLTDQTRAWWVVLIIFIGMTLLLQVFMVSFATREYRPVLLDQAQNALVAQAQAHSKLINNWLEVRRQVVADLAAKPELLAEKMRAYQTHSAKTQSALAALIDRPAFAQVAVFDPDHRPTAQFGAKDAPKAPDVLFEQAAATSKVQFACQFVPGRPGGDCYWVLPVFLNQKEVSSGPWYLVFYAQLTAQTLKLNGQGVALAVPSTTQTLALITPTEDHPEQWVATALIAAPPNADPSNTGVQALTASQWACIHQSPTRANPAAPESAAPLPAVDAIARGHLMCDGQTLWYASTRLIQIPALLWVAAAQDDVLQPLRQTRQSLAIAALVGEFTLIFSLFFLWRIMRIHRKRALRLLQTERDQLAQLWEQIPTLGLTIASRTTPQAPWLITHINRRCMQLFHATREELIGSSLSMLMLPVAAQDDPMDYLISDQLSLNDLVSGIRDELVFLRRLKLGAHGIVWRQFSIRTLPSEPASGDSLIIAIENLGDAVEQADLLQAQRDFYCLATQWLQAKAPERALARTELDASVPDERPTTPQVFVAPLILADQNPSEQCGDTPTEPEPAACLPETPLTHFGSQLIAQTPIVALCRYTHWPEVWSSSSDLSGPSLEQQEHKAYECVGGSAPVREIANRVAAMGLIDRVLVAQTPLFVDDEAKNTPTAALVSLQTELIEQLRPYPVGALAIVPIQGAPDSGCVQAWIVFGDDKLRFTEPIRDSLLSLLNALAKKVAE
jgi:PAS domain-containing protein